MNTYEILKTVFICTMCAGIVSQYLFMHRLKNHEPELWLKFGKLSLLNSKGFLPSLWYVLTGKFTSSHNTKFITACRAYRFFLISSALTFLALITQSIEVKI